MLETSQFSTITSQYSIDRNSFFVRSILLLTHVLVVQNVSVCLYFAVLCHYSNFTVFPLFTQIHPFIIGRSKEHIHPFFLHPLCGFKLHRQHIRSRVCFEKGLLYLLCAAFVKIRPVAILRCTEIHFWDVLWYIWWRLNLCFEWMRSSPAATADPEQIIAVTSVFQGFVVPFMKLQPDRLQRFCSFPMRSTLLFLLYSCIKKRKCHFRT